MRLGNWYDKIPSLCVSCQEVVFQHHDERAADVDNGCTPRRIPSLQLYLWCAQLSFSNLGIEHWALSTLSSTGVLRSIVGEPILELVAHLQPFSIPHAQLMSRPELGKDLPRMGKRWPHLALM